MTKKLFYVEITKSGWVLAENEIEAENFKYDILSTEDLMDIEVSDYSENLLKSTGWDEDCGVYHDNMINGKFLTVREALQND
jgi:hypothetical protein